jgi:5-hydroxyisourate hydrolase
LLSDGRSAAIASEKRRESGETQDLAGKYTTGSAAQRAAVGIESMGVLVSVVDCVHGRPAAGMAVRLLSEADGLLTQQWSRLTDDGGHIPEPVNSPLPPGSYELEIDLERYFAALGFMPLNSTVTVRFRLPGGEYRYGLTLLVTPSACIIFNKVEIRQDGT